jgi:hypothetical protein
MGVPGFDCKPERQPTVRVKILAFAGILLALVLLAFVIQDFVRELFLYPLVYLYWSLRLIYEAIPGAIWWGVAIALLVLLALKSLSQHAERVPAAEEHRAISLTRPQTWARLIKKTRHGDYFKWQLAREISQLALAHIANHERLTLEQAKTKLARGQLDLPPKIQAYLAAGSLAKSYGHYTQTEPELRVPGTQTPIDMDPEEIVSFMENLLASR